MANPLSKRKQKEEEKQKRVKAIEERQKSNYLTKRAKDSSDIIFTDSTVDNKEIASKMKKRAKVHSKLERNITIRMWIDTAISMLRTDRGSIPSDIGDRIFIGNNIFVTKHNMSAILQINEWSTDVPIAFSGILVREIKSKVPDCMIDIKYKCIPFAPDFSDGQIKSHHRQWIATLNNEDASEEEKQRAARLLYSHDVMKSGVSAYQVYAVIFLRSKTNHGIKRAVKIAQSFMRSIGCDTIQIKTRLYDFLPYVLSASNLGNKQVKDLPRNVFTTTTLSESLPVTQGVNADHGVFLGIDGKNGEPYYIDFKNSMKAKNIYIYGMSGSGKTMLVLNWLISGIASGYGACIMDLKGNEFTAFTKACGGKVISMRPGSTCFINTFKMNPNTEEDYKSYFHQNMMTSKQIMHTIADLEPQFYQEADGFFSEFLHAVYLQLGVEQDNPQTWYRTKVLTPAKVYEYFVNYLSNDVLHTYRNVITHIQMSFSTYLKAGGEGHDIFESEYDMRECIDAPVICFDYGMLNARRISDPVVFKLRAIFMTLINDEFIRYRKKQGLWTMKVLEESQVADDFLLKLYKDEFTLRRSQNQVTYLLGNSIISLKDNPDAVALFENINMLAIGKINSTAREVVCKEFGLEDFNERLEQIAKDPELEFRFLFINKSELSTAPELSFSLPDSVKNSKLFKVGDADAT